MIDLCVNINININSFFSEKNALHDYDNLSSAFLLRLGFFIVEALYSDTSEIVVEQCSIIFQSWHCKLFY